MKWINKNIVTISFVWWLIQGILLLLNEIRVYFENSNHFTFSIFVIGIGLIIVSFLLFIKNYKIRLLLSLLVILYSIISLIVLTLIFLVASPSSYCFALFHLGPILNLILSVKLILKKQ
jgi:hypothetical protein